MQCRCSHCDDGQVSPARLSLGYTTCLQCGEVQAKRQRTGWTVVPMNKSNYMLISNPELLKQLNPKRTS